MSLNLECDEAVLWQTPTAVTLAVIAEPTWQRQLAAYKTWARAMGIDADVLAAHFAVLDDAAEEREVD